MFQSLVGNGIKGRRALAASTRSARPVSVSAFTLIELLVVIAIIAILAAILFPVFAQARAKARQASSLSNVRQISMGIMGYISDHDEVLIPAHNCNLPNGERLSWFCSNVNDARLDWPETVLPYIKSPLSGGDSIFKCPDLEADHFNQWSGSPTNSGVKWSQMFVTYAMNVDYLMPNRVLANGSCAQDDLMPQATGVWGRPVGISDMEAPAATVLLTDSKPAVVLDSGAFYPSNLVSSPAARGGNSGVCALDGWGRNSAFESGPEGIGGNTGTAKSGSGAFSTRHSGGGNVTFCDGHSKWMTPGALAAGTNWNANKTMAEVQITNLSQYLWSLKKSGTSAL
ncbi:MAG: prepilin-type N-terminal cleavage/methylation domain-containing protein [Cytophagales bacterium]|nr:prepilin-type N-terminal cleavage/methylation domain-containing protein [Armatimonadota bacterium]